MLAAADKDEEAIHQMRVALRRLRGTLSFAEPPAGRPIRLGQR